MFDYFSANADAGEYGDELRADYDASVKEAWTADLQATVDSVYLTTALMPQPIWKYRTAALDESADMQVAYAMYMWGFADSFEGGVLTTNDSGESFDIAGGTYPTIEDFYEEAVAKYGNAAAYDEAGESAVGASVVENARSSFISTYGAQDESMGSEGVPNISGIQKVDDYTFLSPPTATLLPKSTIWVTWLLLCTTMVMNRCTITTTTSSALSTATLILSATTSLRWAPVLMSSNRYENRTVYFTANENYWKGAPKTKEMQWKETQESDKVASIDTGTADLANPAGSLAGLEEIASYNSNGETTGDTIKTISYITSVMAISA